MSVEITEAELFAELRRLDQTPGRGLPELQYRLIKEARGNTRLTWVQIAGFINEKFGVNYNWHTLANKYYNMSKPK